MRYISTRGRAAPVDFQTALLTGLAPDGGLYLPDRWPRLDATDLAALDDAPYPAYVAATLAGFTDGFADHDELLDIAHAAYGGFSHPDVAPLRDLGEGMYLLELFWGPTLAFKDMAMQMLARMVDRALAVARSRATVLGATSGDTGSAAIEAFRDRENLDVVILYPHGRVSEVQRRQMTTVASPNVHALAVDGTFDDCQDIVKGLFADTGLRARHGLSTANSINWGRVVSQIPYYIWASSRLRPPHRPVTFAVPSGNFGNVFSGYAARLMGLPITRLAVGSNQNHVLTTFFEEGRLSLGPVVPTVAPSMDIQIPSNLERLLYYLLDGDGPALTDAMTALRSNGSLEVGPDQRAAAATVFSSSWIDDDGIRQMMRRVLAETGYLVDPHTAVGLHAASQVSDRPVVALATAHPAKFPATVQAATGDDPSLPPHLADLHDLPEHINRVPAELEAVRAYLEAELKGAG